MEAYLGLDPIFIVNLGEIFHTIVSKDGNNDAARLGSLGQLDSCMQVEACRASHQHTLLLSQATAHLHIPRLFSGFRSNWL